MTQEILDGTIKKVKNRAKTKTKILNNAAIIVAIAFVYFISYIDPNTITDLKSLLLVGFVAFVGITYAMLSTHFISSPSYHQIQALRWSTFTDEEKRELEESELLQ